MCPEKKVDGKSHNRVNFGLVGFGGSYIMGLDEEGVQKFVDFRAAYLKVGILLEENQILYAKVLQNQQEIKEVLGKGWGY